MNTGEKKKKNEMNVLMENHRSGQERVVWMREERLCEDLETSQ